MLLNFGSSFLTIAYPVRLISMFIRYTGSKMKKLNESKLKLDFYEPQNFSYFLLIPFTGIRFKCCLFFLIQNEIIYMHILYMLIHLNWPLEVSHLRRLSTCQMTIQTEPEPQAIRRVAFPVAEIARSAHKAKQERGKCRYLSI